MMASMKIIKVTVKNPVEGDDPQEIPVAIPLDGDLSEKELEKELRASRPLNVRGGRT